MTPFWLLCLGLGLMFQGLLIIWVGGFPLSLQGKLPKAEKGSPQAFGIFWIEQYRLIGFAMTVIGLGLVGLGMA